MSDRRPTVDMIVPDVRKDGVEDDPRETVVLADRPVAGTPRRRGERTGHQSVVLGPEGADVVTVESLLAHGRVTDPKVLSLSALTVT